MDKKDQPKKKNIKFIRFINGDDVVSEVEEISAEAFLMINPMRLIVDANFETSKQTIYMHCYIPQGVAKSNKCVLNMKNILFISNVEEDIIEYYHGIVFEIYEDIQALKAEKKEPKKEYVDIDKKVVSIGKVFKNNTDN
jgi:hypothetical protein